MAASRVAPTGWPRHPPGPRGRAGCRRRAGSSSCRRDARRATLWRMLRYRPGVALIVVDVQNDFADPDGQPARPRRRGRHPGDQPARSSLAANDGALVVCTQDWHPEHTPHFAKDGGIWPDHCIQDTWGAELPPGPRRAGRRPDRPQGRQRRGRLLRLHDARPDAPARPSRPSSTALLREAGVDDGRRHRASRPTTASRRPRSTRGRLGYVHHRPDRRVAAVDLQPRRRRAGARRDARPPGCSSSPPGRADRRRAPPRPRPRRVAVRRRRGSLDRLARP